MKPERKTKTYTCHFGRWIKDENGKAIGFEPIDVRFRVPMEKFLAVEAAIDAQDWDLANDLFDKVLTPSQRKRRAKYLKLNNTAAWGEGF